MLSVYSGCLTSLHLHLAGNRHGLLVPNNTTDQELQHIRNSLPDTLRIQRVEERLSALGNVIACNDYVALVHPDLDRVRIHPEVNSALFTKHFSSSYKPIGSELFLRFVPLSNQVFKVLFLYLSALFCTGNGRNFGRHFKSGSFPTDDCRAGSCGKLLYL